MNPRPLYLQLANMYAPSWGYGGPVRLMFDYARWLNPNFDVQVLSGDLHHDFCRFSETKRHHDGVIIRRCRVWIPKLAKRSVYLVSPLMLIRAALSVRNATGVRIVHIAEFRGLVCLYALLLKWMFGNRILLVHSAFGMLHEKPKLHRTVYDTLFMKAFLKAIGIRLVQNQHEYESYEYLCQMHKVNTGATVLFSLHVDGLPSLDYRFVRGKKDVAALAECRKRYGVPADALAFIFLGRLHPEKGLLRLVNVFCTFRAKSDRNAFLLIVGRDDGFQKEVQRYIEERQMENQVRVVNDVYETRFDYYFLSDIFLGFPTIFEETMLASIEALACGTPIIVSREADIPFVEEEGAGKVIDFELEGAAEVMLTVANNLPIFQVNARATVERHFQARPASESLTRLLRDAIPALLSPVVETLSTKNSAVSVSRDSAGE